MTLRSTALLRDFVLEDPLCRRLANLAEASGRPMALVGGWVRDWLLGREALDWDLVVPGDPTPLASDLARAARGPVVTLDAEFGVVRTRLGDGTMIDLVKQQGPTLEQDLHRRDFTINAMACRLSDGGLEDPTGGLADLEAGLIRAVGRANLEDDPLRVLRAYRFAATLGFAIAPETTGWIRELAPRLAEPAGERVWAELSKLLASPRGPAVITEAVQAGLWAALVPEQGTADRAHALALVARMGELLPRLSQDFGPAGARAAEVIAAPVAADRPVTALLYTGVLLTGLSAAEVEVVGERLHWAKKEESWISPVATQRRVAFELASAPEPLRALYRLERQHQAATLGVILVGLAEGLDPGAGRQLLEGYWELVDRRAAQPRLLTGHDVIQGLGLKPGPALGRVMAALDEAQALGEVRDRAGALAWAARVLAQGE